MQTAKRIDSNGITFSVHIGGAVSVGRPAVVLLHGFPELAFSWRHQFHALAAAGYHVIAPDLRGYGETGPVGPLEDYSMANLARDVIGILDALDLPNVVVTGHDFGGWLTWTLARDYPDRVRGVIVLNTPYTRRINVDLVETMRRTKGNDHYMVTFQDPGVGEAMLGANINKTFDGLMRRTKVTPSEFARLPERIRNLPASLFLGEPTVVGEAILSDQERDTYVRAFTKTGFEGPLNWYRNIKRNWDDTADVADHISQPALFIAAANDYFLPPVTAEGMENTVPRLERHVIADCGHWTQQENPEEVNRLMLNWLAKQS